MDTSNQPLFIRVSRAAELAGLDRHTLQKAIDAGDLKVVQVGSRKMVPMAALRRWALVED